MVPAAALWNPVWSNIYSDTNQWVDSFPMTAYVPSTAISAGWYVRLSLAFPSESEDRLYQVIVTGRTRSGEVLSAPAGVFLWGS